MIKKSKEYKKADFPGSHVVEAPRFHCRGAWVQSLVDGELGSRMPRGEGKKSTKRDTAKDTFYSRGNQYTL